MNVEPSFVKTDSDNLPRIHFEVIDEFYLKNLQYFGTEMRNEKLKWQGPMKEQVELDWMIELKRGKLFTLLGSAHMEMNDDETYTYLMKALKCYGVNFPTTRFFKALKKAHMKLKHMLRFFMTRSVFSRRADDDVSEYCNNVSECLSFLCKFFIIKHRWKEAELAAMWSLSKAIETETDFEKICMAYGNLIFITSNLGHNRMCVALEVFALRTCHKKKTYVELEELKAVSFLYFTISRGRLRRAEIEKFLHIGYVVWRLSTSSQNEMLAFRMLPLLAHVVLLRRQLLEYNNMLQEIQYLFVNDTDNSQMAWYYALCMVVCLETGLIVEPYSKCVKFMQGEGLEPTIRDPDGKMRLIICIWLWEVRNNNWEASMVWQKVAWDFKIRDIGDSVQNFITGLYLIEGLIIYLVNKMDKKNLKAIARTNERLIELFKHYDKGSQYCQVVIPRLYHMKAYYRIARYNDYRGGLKLLKIGKKYAEMYLNDLELLYMKHSELGWCRKLSREDSSFWREHSDEENKLDLNDIDQIDKYIPYTLPVPIYI